jgi:hypothetical protein
MMEPRRIRTSKSEEGIALLISIFVLLLISVVAIALLVSSGTESALAGNYRSATGVYYAASAGLEEVRARLSPQSPISFKNTDPLFLPAAGTPLAVCSPVYVINPAAGEVVTPWDTANPYYDAQFNQEFNGICGTLPNPSPSTPSIWNRSPLNGLPFPGPLYKWVRINGVSELSLKLDTYPYDTKTDPTLVYYDGTHLTDVPNSGPQVLEITALAVLPNGSQKLLQYLLAPGPIALPPFLAALTLSGSPGRGVSFHAPASNSSYAVKGDDYTCSNPPASTGVNPHAAIGLLTDSNSDVVHVKNGIPSSYQQYYTGLISPGPDVEDISSTFPLNLQSPSNLDALAQSIVQNADAVVITPTPSGTPPYLGTATRADLTPLGMSSTNPLTVIVNGNLDISNWSSDGYGLLLVTGTFTYDPDTNWYGIILVIGQGVVNNSQNGQNKQINGAMLVAKTRDLNNQVLTGSNLGGATVQFLDAMGGTGMRYSSCWIQKAQPKGKYKILSFHEISQ